MDIVAIVLLGALVVGEAVAIVCLARLWRRPAAPAPVPNPWEVVVARRCVVNLKSGRAVDGVLVRKEGPLLFLKNAVLLEQGSEPATIDGEAVVQAVHIDFIQAL